MIWCDPRSTIQSSQTQSVWSRFVWILSSTREKHVSPHGIMLLVFYWSRYMYLFFKKVKVCCRCKLTGVKPLVKSCNRTKVKTGKLVLVWAKQFSKCDVFKTKKPLRFTNIWGLNWLNKFSCMLTLNHCRHPVNKGRRRIIHLQSVSVCSKGRNHWSNWAK